MIARLAILSAALMVAGCVSSNPTPKMDDKEAAAANVKLGVAYMQQNNLALAKEKLERAEKQDPRNLEVHTSLAFLYERLKDPEEAEQHYRTAQRLAPDSPDVANNYAVFLCRNQRVDDAIVQFETAAKNPLYRTPWAAQTNAAVCLRSAKRTKDAVPYLERALALRPNYVDAVLEMGEAQIELGRPDLATNVIERYLSLGQASPEVLLVGLRAAIARGDKAAMDNYARRLRRDFPNSPQTRALPQLLQGKG